MNYTGQSWTLNSPDNLFKYHLLKTAIHIAPGCDGDQAKLNERQTQETTVAGVNKVLKNKFRMSSL